jgi:hypothetical protein
MKVEVIKRCKDRETNKLLEVGAKLTVAKDRGESGIKRGFFKEIKEPKTKEKKQKIETK